VGVVCNAALGAETRRSAAQQLAFLASDRAVGAALATAPLLWLLLRTATAAAAVAVHACDDDDDDDEEEEGEGEAQMRRGRATLQPGYSVFAPLAHAALELLSTLVMHQPAAQGWLMAADAAAAGGGGSLGKGVEAAPRVLRLLHLVFHRNVTVRRAVAHTLGRLLFHPCVVDPSGGGDAADARVAGAASMRLPAPFMATYRFPFAALEAPPYAGRSRPGAAAEAPHAAAEAGRVARMVALRRLLAALADTHGDERSLSEALAAAAASGAWRDGDESPQLLTAEAAVEAAATLAACLPLDSLPRALEALSVARSHGAASAALAALRLAAASDAAAAALAAQDWPTALGRFLATTPASVGDRRLWAQLLELVRTLLHTGALAERTLGYLAAAVAHAGAPLLAAVLAAATAPVLSRGAHTDAALAATQLAPPLTGALAG
jgi:hypothetical protein